MVKIPPKKNLIYSLFISAIVLILGNILIEKYFIKQENRQQLQKISVADANEKFKAVLQSFGIDEDLIKLKNNNNDKFNFYNITVPADLPIPVILNDIFLEFKNSCEIKSEENEAGGKSSLTLLKSDETILSAKFTYSKNIIRKKGTIGILINDVVIDATDDSLIYISPEKFCTLLIPSTENAGTAVFIQSKSKEYALLLNDDISELEYKIKQGYNPSRIKAVIRTILCSFPRAIFFVIDDNSDLFNSDAFELVKTELKKRNIKIILLSNFLVIKAEDSYPLIDEFDESVKNLQPEEVKSILVSIDGYRDLDERIAAFRKIGVRFVNLSSINFNRVNN